MPSKPLESSFDRRYVKPYLDELERTGEGFFIRLWLIAHLGLPDRVGVLRGRFIALEVKRGGAEARKTTGRTVLQRHNLTKVWRAGGYGTFVYPENWGEVHHTLEIIRAGFQGPFPRPVDPAPFAKPQAR